MFPSGSFGHDPHWIALKPVHSDFYFIFLVKDCHQLCVTCLIRKPNIIIPNILFTKINDSTLKPKTAQLQKSYSALMEHDILFKKGLHADLLDRLGFPSVLNAYFPTIICKPVRKFSLNQLYCSFNTV